MYKSIDPDLPSQFLGSTSFGCSFFPSRRRRPSSNIQKEKKNDLTLISHPKEILVEGILSFLDRDSILHFLECLGRKRVKLMKLEKYHCINHGAKLELFDLSSRFSLNSMCSTAHRVISSNNLLGLNKNKTNQHQQHRQKKSCPDCIEEKYNLKLCGRCKKFHPKFTLSPSGCHNNNPNGIWCQKCEKMAFCNTCMIAQRCSRKKCKTSKCYTCCTNVFTNTICGDFVCNDCADISSITIEECNDCGKATCLDANCIICSDVRLMSLCTDNPDDNIWYNCLVVFFGALSLLFPYLLTAKSSK